MDDVCMPQRVLITQSVFSDIGGSEVQAYEVASYFRDIGCKVYLYAWFVDRPMSAILEKAGFHVLTPDDEESYRLNITDFDLIWAHHEVLPISLIHDLTSADARRDSQFPLVVFAHMSSYREVHIEHAYTYGMEKSIGDLVVCNSEVTRQALINKFSYGDVSAERYCLFPNPAPQEFCDMDYVTSSLHKILIVSNHPPAELLDAADILRQQGYVVDRLSSLGDGSGSRLVDAELLSQYQCVISIGKTVQYCLVSGVPVFLYDRFAGPGYLSDDNIDTAAYYTFSGRSDDDDFSLLVAMSNAQSRRRDPQTLAVEIVDGYTAAIEYQRIHRDDFLDRYSIEKCVEGTLVAAYRAHEANTSPLPQSYVNYLVQNQEMISGYVTGNKILSNPLKNFYNQKICFFESTDDGFSQENSFVYGQLSRPQIIINNLKINQFPLRIDFGELPCVITDIEVSVNSNNRVHISSNATCNIDGLMIFMEADPQIIIDGDVMGADGDKLDVNATIFPLDSIPGQIVREISKSFVRKQLQLADSETRYDALVRSKWWRLGERLREIRARLVR